MAIGTDKVQVLKQESAALGGNPADDVPYPSPINPQTDAAESAGLYVQDLAARDETVGVFRDADQLQFFDQVTPDAVSLARLMAVSLAGGEGPWRVGLSGAYRECTPSGAFPTQVIWWTDSSKVKKIAQKLITAGGAIFPTAVQWSVFAADGTTVIAQVTDVIAYSGAFETHRTRTVT